jgi:hypothetical protein
MATFARDVPLVSATQFNVAPISCAAGSGAYGTASTAGTGDWVLGSVLKGRRLLVVVNTGAIANAPTALKVSLFGSGTDANGSSGAEIAASVTEWATPAGDIAYQVEMDLGALVTDVTKYYSLALNANGAGATSTVLAGCTGHFLEPIFKS